MRHVRRNYAVMAGRGDPVQELEMLPGDGLIVPKGTWHRVDVLEPSQIVYLTPGPGGEYRLSK